MKYLLIFILAISGGFLGGYGYSNYGDQLLGATIARTTITNQWTFAATTTHSGNIVVTPSNTATTSLGAQCWQLTATSTASPLKAVPAAISTTTTTFGNGTVGFPLIAVPGTCPRI